MMAMGVLLLWLQELRLLYIMPSIGPLVFIVFEMWKDVAKWFILQFFLVMSFGVAFFALYGGGENSGLEEVWGDRHTPGPPCMAHCSDACMAWCMHGFSPHPDLSQNPRAWWLSPLSLPSRWRVRVCVQCSMALDDSMMWSKNFAELDNSITTDEQGQGFFMKFFDMVQFDTIARFHDASQGLFYMLPLFGISITGNDKIDCLRRSEHSLTGPVFMVRAPSMPTPLLLLRIPPLTPPPLTPPLTAAPHARVVIAAADLSDLYDGVADQHAHCDDERALLAGIPGEQAALSLP